MNRETYIGHNSDLCGKCIELGHSCQNESDDDEVVDDSHLAQLIDEALVIQQKPSQKERKRQNKMAKFFSTPAFIEHGIFDGGDGRATAEDCIEAFKNPQCKSIKMSHSKSFGDKGAELIAVQLASNKTVKSLNVAQCDIGDKGTIALAKALCKNKSLEELVIHGNPIGTQGLLELASMLKSNNTLLRLNAIGAVATLGVVDQDRVKAAFLEAVQLGETLEILQITNFNWSKALKAEMLKQPETKQEIEEEPTGK